MNIGKKGKLFISLISGYGVSQILLRKDSTEPWTWFATILWIAIGICIILLIGFWNGRIDLESVIWTEPRSDEHRKDLLKFQEDDKAGLEMVFYIATCALTCLAFVITGI